MVIAKDYIERKYKLKKVKEEESKKEWEIINEKIKDLNINYSEEVKIKEEILKKEAEKLRKKREKQSVNDYISLSVIGKGAFGEVRVCRSKNNNKIVAIKKLVKEEMHRKNQIIHVRTEKEILLKAMDHDWVVNLISSFQDEKHLYLVMDFLPGGDLMTQLIAKDIFSEKDSKFYMAELVLAVESVHKLNCIHRDLKPDNILIDKRGHIKLSDFGLCKLLNEDLYSIYGNENSNKLLNKNAHKEYKLNKNSNFNQSFLNKFKRQRRMVR